MVTISSHITYTALATLLAALLPVNVDLHCTDLTCTENQLTLALSTTTSTSVCPTCHHPSSHVHSRYIRTLTDVPCGARHVRYRVTVRRFRCRHGPCPQHIFAERLPSLTAVYARQTTRARQELTAIGLALGGTAGARRSQQQHLPVSATTLLRLIRATALPDPGAPHAIGLDEWAWRRGHRYGTLIVDLTTHRVLDLLPDRAATTVAAWLRQHPTIQVICRDRFAAYADGAAWGAPQAMQVADRFHLVQNLTDTLVCNLQQHPTVLQTAAEATAQQQRGPVIPLETPSDHMAATHQQRRRRQWHQRQEARQHQRLTQQRARYTQVHALQRQGWTVAAMARELGVSRKTIYVYLRQERPPGPREYYRHRPDRVLAPYEAYLQTQWAAGCHNSSQLWRMIRVQGYRGSQRTVTRFVHQLRQAARDGMTARPAVTPFTRRRGPAVRDVVRLLLRPPDQRSTIECQYLHQLKTQAPALAASCELTELFLAMIRERDGVRLHDWMTRVDQIGCVAFQRFARGLRADWAAIQAALTLPWSNGVEQWRDRRTCTSVETAQAARLWTGGLCHPPGTYAPYGITETQAATSRSMMRSIGARAVEQRRIVGGVYRSHASRRCTESDEDPPVLGQVSCWASRVLGV